MSVSSNTFLPEQLSFRSERVLHEQHAFQLELTQHIEQLRCLDVLLNDCRQHHQTRKAHLVLQILSNFERIHDLSEVLDATWQSVKSCLGAIQELNNKAIAVRDEASFYSPFCRRAAEQTMLRKECSRNIVDDPLMDEIINGAVTHMIGFVEKVDAKLEGSDSTYTHLGGLRKYIMYSKENHTDQGFSNIQKIITLSLPAVRMVISPVFMSAVSSQNLIGILKDRVLPKRKLKDDMNIIVRRTSIYPINTVLTCAKRTLGFKTLYMWILVLTCSQKRLVLRVSHPDLLREECQPYGRLRGTSNTKANETKYRRSIRIGKTDDSENIRWEENSSFDDLGKSEWDARDEK
ncbi:hypothetical protein C8J55DRAFT_485278 [Lentinula edodes]|uniref:Uncharacterized protein n=1 Tax=Lentinula lateritia TaxID=40482 RepID=A0A9W9B060_9AGAR|nr:hypothetical protein C8J55DRAFT_485278 [Lentinula edodes]